MEVNNHIDAPKECQGHIPLLLTRTQQSDTGLCMKGYVRTKEKCPRCSGKFVGTPLRCPSCGINPKKYYADIHVKGHGRLRIFSDRTGHSLDSHERANRVLIAIRYEIDQHIFDPSRYVSTNIKNFLFENRIEAWLASKEKEVEKGNLAPSYIKNLKNYKNNYYLPFFKGKDIREIRAYHIHQFYEQLPKKEPKYLKNIMNALENFFSLLVRFEFITHRPAFPKITVDRKAPKWVDADTRLEYLKAIPEADRPIFIFLAFQGVRPGEARALRVKDLDLKKGVLIVSRTYSGRIIREKVKSKVVRPRLINPILIPLLEEACRNKHPEAFVFLNPRVGRSYSENVIYKIWKGMKEKLGLDITPYQATRHTVASIALNNGAPLVAIKDVLGHTDIRTTLKYAHLEIETQRVVFQNQAEILELYQQTVKPEKKD